jgi:hypothetical protein
MGVIKIKDLPMNRALDVKALSSIRGGGGAPWVFGAFRPFVEETPSFGVPPTFNLYNVTNNFFAENISNKSVSINNSGDNASVNAVLISALTAS